MIGVSFIECVAKRIVKKVTVVAASAALCGQGYSSVALPTDPIDLSGAVVVTRPGDLPHAEEAAAIVLLEEVESRTGLRLATATEWPTGKTVIAITSQSDVPAWGRRIPARQGTNLPESAPEGYRLFGDEDETVWVIGADGRGTLYGVGALMRKLIWRQGQAAIPAGLDIATAPAYPIRGHQLGFRTQANSWDAWTPEQFDQYIRELTFFGLNSVENIPFHDDRPTPVMKVDRREMNRRMSGICARYGLDYWVWTPAATTSTIPLPAPRPSTGTKNCIETARS